MIVMALARSSGGAYVVVIVEYIRIHADEWKGEQLRGGQRRGADNGRMETSSSGANF
jgi:hypothetical protein